LAQPAAHLVDGAERQRQPGGLARRPACLDGDELMSGEDRAHDVAL
jgi:hypothetical protein